MESQEHHHPAVQRLCFRSWEWSFIPQIIIIDGFLCWYVYMQIIKNRHISTLFHIFIYIYILILITTIIHRRFLWVRVLKLATQFAPIALDHASYQTSCHLWPHLGRPSTTRPPPWPPWPPWPHTGAAPLAAKAVVGGLGAPSAATGSEDGATWGTPLEGLALP